MARACKLLPNDKLTVQHEAMPGSFTVTVRPFEALREDDSEGKGRSQLLDDGGWNGDAQLLRGHLGDHVVLAAVACELAAGLLLEVAHQPVHLHPSTAHKGPLLP